MHGSSETSSESSSETSSQPELQPSTLEPGLASSLEPSVTSSDPMGGSPTPPLPGQTESDRTGADNSPTKVTSILCAGGEDGSGAGFTSFTTDHPAGRHSTHSTMSETDISEESSGASTAKTETSAVATVTTLQVLLYIARLLNSCAGQPTTTGPDQEASTVSTCSANVCRNGGTCLTTISGFQCHCRLQYAGRHCEQEVTVDTPGRSNQPSESCTENLLT